MTTVDDYVDFVGDAGALLRNAAGAIDFISSEKQQVTFFLLKNRLIRSIDHWVFCQEIIDVEKMQRNERFINTLLSTLSTGKVSLRDMQGIQAFDAFLLLRFERTPDIIEYHMHTEDFMPLLRLIFDEQRRVSNQGGDDTEGIVIAKVKRLCDFDMALSDEERAALPLEIRMQLSGFYDEER